jgi:hypothetical protein
MSTRNFLLGISVRARSGCVHSSPVQTTFDPAYPEHNGAGDSIDAVLEGRNPTTYWLGQQGAWTTRRGLQEYPNGMVYQPDASADPSLQYLGRVNDEVVLVLDQALRPKAGNAAWGFMLSRDCSPYGPRTYPYDERARRFLAANATRCEPPPVKTQHESADGVLSIDYR